MPRRRAEPSQSVAAPEATPDAAERLRQGGHRVTSARMLVLGALRSSDKPLAAAQVFAAVKREGGHIDMVSVYRSLAILASLDLVHHVGSVDGYVACQLTGDHDSGVAHVVCNRCGRADEAALAPETYQAIVAETRTAGFACETVKVEVVGMCDDCQAG